MLTKKVICVFTAAFCMLAALPKSGYSASAYDVEALKDDIRVAIENHEEYVDTSDIDVTLQNSFDAFEAVIFENPQFFYVTRSIYGNELGFKLSYEFEGDELTAMQTQISEELDSILSHVTDDMTDAQKVCAVHDYIVLTYDYNVSGTLEPWNFNIYGLMTKKTGVCQAYAETFVYVMNQLGIESKLVVGDANGGGHAWNCVKLGGVWYQLDATWDDVIVDYTDHYISHDYFLISDSAMSADHNYVKSNYPACDKSYDKISSLLYTYSGGVKYSFDTTIMYDYPSGIMDTTFVVPSTVYAIADSDSSWYNPMLEEVVIPDSVEHISTRAFSGCKKLTTIRGAAGSEAERFAKANGYTFEEVVEKLLLGDVNGDGKISSLDALEILYYCARMTELEEKRIPCADMNIDGKITPYDAYLLLILYAKAA